MKRLVLFLAVAALFAGCYPKGPKYVSELDLALTNFDSEFDFENKKTYVLIDEIFHPEDAENISREYDDQILARIEANMNNLGYERLVIENPTIPALQDADMVITVSAWNTTSINYYGGYYPPYWGGWGWYYPPGWGFVTTSTFGSVLIDMSDPREYVNETVSIVWSGLVNGMVSNSSTSSIQQRIDDGIDQCFSHPPFDNQ